MVSAIFYIFYAGVTNTFNLILYISIALLAIETTVLSFNKWTCPLTPLARKYDSGERDNFDIYLPNWLAKYNKAIFGTIFVAGMILVIFNWVRNL
jgi:hypothetical protein